LSDSRIGSDFCYTAWKMRMHFAFGETSTDDRMSIATTFLRAGRYARAGIRLPLDDIAGECAAIVALAPMLLVVAVWNRFPLIYYDTGAYVLEGLGDHFLVERSPVYSLFLRVAGAGFSLWTIIILQAVACAFVMVECARCLVPKFSLGLFLALGAGLIVATGLPWYVGQVEPDCFAALAVLSIYLLAFHAGPLGPTRRHLLLAIGSFASAVHSSHLLLAAGLWLSLALYLAIRKFATSNADWPKPHLAGPAIMIAIAVSLVISANFVFTRQIFVSRAGPSFVFARLLQDRIVSRLLDETCPRSGYRLCEYKDVLPPTANAWLWSSYSPFVKLGGFDGTRAESAKIVWDSLARYPLWNLEMAFADAGRQLFAFKTGDQVEPQQWALRPTMAHFLPSQIHGYLSARQQLGEIDFRIVNRVHVPMAYLSLLLLVLSLPLTLWWAERDATLFLAVVALSLLGNALICGALSNPHDRYQSRLIWMVPFAVALVAASRATTRRNIGMKTESSNPSQYSAYETSEPLAGGGRIRH
jgi:hypothetical protein